MRHTISIEEIRSLCDSGSIVWSEHCGTRMRGRKIKRADVLCCVQNGEIIEDYPADIAPSCLIFGLSTAENILHAVCGIKDDTVHMITAYYPSKDKWEDDYKTRKAVK
ncbi:MAG: DUF4258 domain-containing protein [Clostridia bacterium]|nr:DUF4258 domain-containing protein [Clostridia bacterium]